MMQRSLARMTFVLLAVLLGHALLGCSKAGPPRVAVSGNVSLDGRPLDRGAITFIANGTVRGPKAIGVITAGKYEITADDGPLVGPLLVQIRSGDFAPPEAAKTITGNTTTINGKAVPLAPDGRPLTGLNGQPDPNVAIERIPDCYNKNSTLTAEATLAGPNQFNFPLLTRPHPNR